MKRERMEEQENNTLIAKFMGYTFSKSGKTARIGKGNKSSAYRLSDLHYHDSWSLIMPVIDKIKNTLDGSKYWSDVIDLPIWTSLSVVNYNIVQFIRYYNESEY